MNKTEKTFWCVMMCLALVSIYAGVRSGNNSSYGTCTGLLVNVHNGVNQPIEAVRISHDYRPYDFTVTTPDGDCYVLIKDGKSTTLRLYKQGYELKKVAVASGTKEISVTLKAKEE